MITGLSGRVAIVTGGASGIGLATAERLAVDGATVIAWDRYPPSEAIRSIAFQTVDIACEANVETALADALAAHGAIDILVNSAGVAAGGALWDMELGDWDRVIGTNLRGSMLVCRAVLPFMRAKGVGAIVNVGSTFGLLAREATTAYGVSKAGVIHLTKCLAVDLADSGVRVNCVCPGLVETPLTAPVFTPDNARIHEREIAAHAMRRSGTVREVAEAIAFLASDEASYVTGSVLTVDGGYTAGKWDLPG